MEQKYIASPCAKARSTPRLFPVLVTGDSLSALGDGLFFVGVSWLILARGGSALDIGLYLALSSVAGIILSPIYGSVVDRYSKKTLCIMSDLARAIVIFWLATVSEGGTVSLLPILLSGFILSACDRLFWPASSALIREIVADGQLAKAYSIISFSGQTGTIVGAALAGVVIDSLGYKWLFWIDGATFLISSIAIFLQRPTNIATANERVPLSYLAGLSSGIQHFSQSGLSKYLFAQLTFVYILFYSTNTLLPTLVKDSLHGTATDFGLIDGAWAVGSIVSGALLGSAKWVPVWRLLGIASLFVQGILLLALSSASSILSVWLLYFMLGSTFNTSKTVYDTQFQLSLPASIQGRARSVFSFVMSWISPAIYVSAGYFSTEHSARSAYMVVAIIVFLGCVLALTSKLSERNHE